MTLPDPEPKPALPPRAPIPAAPARKPASVFLALFALLLQLTTTGALAARDAAPPTAAVAEKHGDLKALRGQIDSLRKDMASSETRRADVADQLKDVEQAISRTQREVTRLATQRTRLQATLSDLASALRELESQLGRQQAQLEELVYRQYVQGKPDALRLMLSGDEPSQVARDLHYLTAIARARSALLHETEATLQRKQALAANTRARSEELAGVEAEHREQHGKLLAQREQRQALLEQISAKISQQRRAIGNLQRDEKRLSQLIVRLAELAKKQARAQAKEQARAVAKPPRGKETQKEARPGRAEVAELNNEKTPEASPAGHFARLKGALRLPARGVVSNRFGGARQEGSTWKGLFIRAAAGSEVRAIAAGRVVFADWMRGFGNLLIVDHGSSYLSIYGNNDALLKQTGETVRGGETIAAVGNSGGNPESGLYFELRYQGQPLDPLKWVSLK